MYSTLHHCAFLMGTSILQKTILGLTADVSNRVTCKRADWRGRAPESHAGSTDEEEAAVGEHGVLQAASRVLSYTPPWRDRDHLQLSQAPGTQ